MADATSIRYSYAGSPTLEDFSESNAFIRGLMGALGSGKSSACCIEIVNRALAQRPSPDGIRRTRWAVIRQCYDDQTEILTENRGWQFFRDLLPDDKVAQLRDDKLEFVLPTHHYAAPYVGEMVGFEGEGIDFRVTPTHKMWVSEQHTRKRVWAPYSLRHAQDIYGRQTFRVKRDAQWDGDARGYSEAFFEWLGFWFAEGCAHARVTSKDGYLRYHCAVTQHKPAGLVYAHDLFKRAGLAYNTAARPGGQTLTLCVEGNRALIAELATCGKAVDKRMPPWMKGAPSGHLRAFINGFVAGDGWHIGNSTFAATSSQQMADDLQEIALKAGMVANVACRPMRAPRPPFKANSQERVVTFLRPSKYEPLLRKSAGRYKGWYKEHYDGLIYCVEVPTHVVYVRRNGRAMWCSQTFPELRDTTIRTLFEWLPPRHFGRYLESKHSYLVTAFPNVECEILFLALERPEDVKKLLSLEITGAWINEAREVPWAVVEAIQGRIGRYPSARQGGASWSGLWMDTNAPDADSEWHEFFENQKWLKDFQRLKREGLLPASMAPDDYVQLFKQPSGLSANAENLPNLPGGRMYYSRIMAGKSAEWIKIYVHGEYGYIVEGLPVTPEYSDRVHCQEVDPIPGLPIIRSYDWGLTPACAFSQVLPDGRWLTFDEMVSTNMSADEFGDQVVEHCNRAFRGEARFEDYGDPAGAQRAQTDKKTCFEIFEAKGILVQPSIQNPQMRHESLRKPMRTLVGGEPQFILHPRCKRLRKGLMGGWHYRRLRTTGADRYSEQAEKNQLSHICEALEYGTVQYFAPALTERPGYDDYPSTEDNGAYDRNPLTGY